jgi:phosphohistidine phosphatase
MRLYFMRHGKAEEAGLVRSDAERALTEEGREEVRRMARRLWELKVHCSLVLASPLVRARETAEIVAAEWEGAALQEAAELAPGGELEAWLPSLSAWRTQQRGDLMLVGHAPGMGDWAEMLVWGRAEGRLAVKKAGVVGVLLPDSGDAVGRSELFWLTSVKLLL